VHENVLAHTLNERFDELGDVQAVPYPDE